MRWGGGGRTSGVELATEAIDGALHNSIAGAQDAYDGQRQRHVGDERQRYDAAKEDDEASDDAAAEGEAITPLDDEDCGAHAFATRLGQSLAWAQQRAGGTEATTYPDP